MAYTNKEQIRRITNITSTEISDDDLTALITDATAQLNSDINTLIIREKVEFIDDTRENTIDGSNTTFYVKNWSGKYLGDMDDDGDVDTSDIKVYLVNSDGTESEATVSSVTYDQGKFVLSTAPTTTTASEMYVTYTYSTQAYNSKKVSLACAILTAAYAYWKLNTGLSPKQSYGNVRFERDMKAGNDFFSRYENLVTKLNDEMGDWKEAEDII